MGEIKDVKQIKTNELRIGNWVVMDGTLIHMDTKMFHAVIHGFSKYEPEPITINKEWLDDKFGFKPTSLSADRILRYKFPDDDRFEIRLGKGNIDLWVYLEGNILTDVKYVHQLQNLYFALTGEELSASMPYKVT